MTINGQQNAIKVKNVVATMAIENMYFNTSFLQKMVKVANGEISSEEMRKEVIQKYAR